MDEGALRREVGVDVDVLVVGAGPAGLTLACDLARRGVDHRIVDAAPSGFDGSRAKGVQPRTAEVLDDLGVLSQLQEHATLYPKLGIHLGPFTVPKTMIEVHDETEDVPHPNTLLVAQRDTDAALRQRLADLGGSVELDTRLTSFDQSDDLVTAVIEHAGGVAEEVRARYLIGADGGSSLVRRGCGIDFPGTTEETDRMVVADLSLTGLSRHRWHIWPRRAGRFTALCPLPDGRWQLMLKLRPDESPDLDSGAIARLVHAVVGRAKVTVTDIHWASVWRPNTRLAERYRAGRVLLVGDAAHVHPPTGGQGMNTGIQDSYNLGWKLAAVLGGAPDDLLDTYEAERQPVAARVLGLSSRIYRATSDRPLAATTRGDEERQLQLSYAGGPLAPADTDRPTVGLGAGDRAPDARYVDAAGNARRLHDAFRGPHFTLLAIGAGAATQAGRIPWPRTGSDLHTVVIEEPGPALRQAYAVSESVLILVRPDGYIAARTPHDQPTAITAFVEHLTSRA